MGRNLYQKIFEKHKVKQFETGQCQLFIGLHLVHEVTSPQAFAMLEEQGLNVVFPNRTFATVDHIIPTVEPERQRPYKDDMAEQMIKAIESSTQKHNIQFFSPEDGSQGIVHVVAPESGLTQPGLTIACGDSHTATHGAFGSLAFGIGTSQVSHILATQTMIVEKLKVRRINITGKLRPGVYAKDIILAIINKLGVNGGVGYAYEYAGSVISNMSMEERMTICNMSIEGGAKIGYCNPDDVTISYLKGRKYIPTGSDFEKAREYWLSVASDSDAQFDDVIEIDASTIGPQVTWGITPGQSIDINALLPEIETFDEEEQPSIQEAYNYMSLMPGQPIKGLSIDVVFIGSCTNGRLSDFEEAARLLKGRKVASGITALAVPGSYQVKKQAEARGLHTILTDAGFEWREPGCSMCLAMNPDKLIGSQICASTSNRNFKGRQGSTSGRTILMSPAMAAAAAVTGKVMPVDQVFDNL